MGIILPEKILQSLLLNRIETFNGDASVELPEILEPEIYGTDAISSLLQYFSINTIKVKAGYPKEDTTSPSIYIATGDESFEESTVGYGERENLATDTIATYEVKIFRKSVRVIAVSNNPVITPVLTAICKYYIHQQEDWLNTYRMQNVKVSVNELDFINKFFPQEFLYRTLIASFDVEDMIIVSKDDTIKGIDVNVFLLV